MLTGLLLWWGVALAGPPTPVDEAMDEVITGLSPRHTPSACADLPGGPEGDAALIAVVDAVPYPPWVPQRAARCVVERAADDEQLESVLTGWLADAERPGLGLEVVEGLVRLPPDLADRRRALAVERAAGDARFGQYALPVLARQSVLLRDAK